MRLLLVSAFVLTACGSHSGGDNSAEIAHLRAARMQALDQKDGHEASRLTLDLDYQLELRDLAAQPETDGGEARARLERKYSILRQAMTDAETTAAHLAPNAEERISPIAYNPQELAAVHDVMSIYGDLYIGPTDGDEVRLDKVPWAGYWYPLAGTELFGTSDAPLAKLDKLAAALGQPGGTAQWEIDHHRGVPPAAWEGYCSAWAVSAVTEAEPTRTLEYKGVVFSPSDQKALLTKVHELYPVRQFGIRYNGDQDTDGTFQDLRPEAFHRLAQRVIGEMKEPLVADTDPGVEVWSKPLYRVRWVVKPDPAHVDAFLVSAYPWFVKHRTAVSDAATSDADYLTAVFEYRLYVDKQTVRNGQFLVVAGEWLNNSLGAHPDYLLLPAANGAWGSQNTALQASLDVVHGLFQNGTPR